MERKPMSAGGNANPGLVVLVIVLLLAIATVVFLWRRDRARADEALKIEVGAVMAPSGPSAAGPTGVRVVGSAPRPPERS